MKKGSKLSDEYKAERKRRDAELGISRTHRVICKEDIEKMIAKGKNIEYIAKKYGTDSSRMYDHCKRIFGESFDKVRKRVYENGATEEIKPKRQIEGIDKRRYVIYENDFKKLCGLQCTLKEIAGFFECNPATVKKWCKETYGREFDEVYDVFRQKGLVGLRRNQMKLSDRSSTMAIFLGKNLLGQTDKQTIETSSSNDGALSNLSEEELREILNIGKKKDIEVIDKDDE